MPVLLMLHLFVLRLFAIIIKAVVQHQVLIFLNDTQGIHLNAFQRPDVVVLHLSDFLIRFES